ncbi:MAG: MBL fold metallo-hydrolase [Planctomycetes bacterium]|nr:MBL fold metallo-hydrolase [Planctomycetota bacterium]
MPELQFHGAAGEVTGSMHILHVPGGPVLLDCGMFQGRRAEAIGKNRRLPLRPQSIQAILLSHAHMDHSGNIPYYVRSGLRCPIYSTPATCDLCDIMLADSAHIQEEDAKFWNEKRARSAEDWIDPLYTMEDARAARHFFHPVPYDQPLQFGDGCKAVWIEAGHILGAACVLVEAPNGGRPIKILYTGDLGRFDMPILRDPTCPLPQADYLITESTYADKIHHNPTDQKEQLVRIIDETRAAGGKVIIPSFSIGRTQNIVYYLSHAIREGLMAPLPIYVDSPLSTHATEVFKKHPECYDEDALKDFKNTGDIFGHGLVEYITDTAASKALNDRREPMVIIAASGMCEAGRILHHLKNNVEDESNTVIVVGFMAQHTLGRRIVERRDEIKIYGRFYKLLCRVEVLNGLSAHADAADFARCLGPIAPGLKAAFAVHGEGTQPAAMADILKKAGCKNTFIPKPGEKFQLT